MLTWLKKVVNGLVGKGNDTIEVASADSSELYTPVGNIPAACGCGRSPTGKCVGLHRLSDEQWNASPLNPKNSVSKVEVSTSTDKPAKKTKSSKKTVKLVKPVIKDTNTNSAAPKKKSSPKKTK